MDIVKVFGTNLRTYRNQLGVSQERFAEMCGLHRTYISDIAFSFSVDFKDLILTYGGFPIFYRLYCYKISY